MPCRDISEVIRLEFDASGRLQTYSLNKQTCGTEIGQTALLIGMLRDLCDQEILQLTRNDLMKMYPLDESTEFAYAKHLTAVQLATGVLTGKADGSTGQMCVAACITYDPAGSLHFEGIVAGEALQTKIPPCGQCGTCRP